MGLMGRRKAGDRIEGMKKGRLDVVEEEGTSPFTTGEERAGCPEAPLPNVCGGGYSVISFSMTFPDARLL